jgi:hypothetical protein
MLVARVCDRSHTQRKQQTRKLEKVKKENTATAAAAAAAAAEETHADLATTSLGQRVTKKKGHSGSRVWVGKWDLETDGDYCAPQRH